MCEYVAYLCVSVSVSVSVSLCLCVSVYHIRPDEQTYMCTPLTHSLTQSLLLLHLHRYYSATILKLSGFTGNTQVIWLSAVVAFCNFLGSCVGLRLGNI